MKLLFVVFFFFDWVFEVGIVIDFDVVEVVVMFLDFEVVVKKICVFSIDELVEEYLKLKEDIRKFLCMDLIY